MTEEKCPCRLCGGHRENCHSGCSRYRNWKQFHEANKVRFRNAAREETEYASYIRAKAF